MPNVYIELGTNYVEVTLAVPIFNSLKKPKLKNFNLKNIRISIKKFITTSRP